MEQTVGGDVAPGSLPSSPLHKFIPAEQGISAIDDEDEDVKLHGEKLGLQLQEAYTTAQNHIIDVKKRLIEEKEIALAEAERHYQNQYDKYQNEIKALRNEIRNLGGQISTTGSNYMKLSGKSASLVGRRSLKYSSTYSVKKLFDAWHEEVKISQHTNKMDRIAKEFTNKYILARSFFTLALNFQRRKAAKQSAEAKFKFDSVTTEIITSYESQLQRSREDLTEAYVTIEEEQLRRLKLEEDLRRLFLKNMTAMNFEALSLFSNSYNMVEPPSTGATVGTSPPPSVGRNANHSGTPSSSSSSSSAAANPTPFNGSNTKQHSSGGNSNSHSNQRSPPRTASSKSNSGSSGSNQRRSAQKTPQSKAKQKKQQQQQPSPEEVQQKQQFQYQIEQLLAVGNTGMAIPGGGGISGRDSMNTNNSSHQVIDDTRSSRNAAPGSSQQQISNDNNNNNTTTTTSSSNNYQYTNVLQTPIVGVPPVQPLLPGPPPGPSSSSSGGGAGAGTTPMIGLPTDLTPELQQQFMYQMMMQMAANSGSDAAKVNNLNNTTVNANTLVDDTRGGVGGIGSRNSNTSSSSSSSSNADFSGVSTSPHLDRSNSFASPNTRQFTNQISEMYQSNISTTERLANNTPPGYNTKK